MHRMGMNDTTHIRARAVDPGMDPEPLLPRVHGEIENNFGFLDAELADHDYFVGDDLTAADINLTFVIQAAKMLYTLEKFPRLAAFLSRVQARPAYRRAIERGGPFAYG